MDEEHRDDKDIKITTCPSVWSVRIGGGGCCHTIGCQTLRSGWDIQRWSSTFGGGGTGKGTKKQVNYQDEKTCLKLCIEKLFFVVVIDECIIEAPLVKNVNV